MTIVDRRPPHRPQLRILTSLRFFAAAEVIIFHFGRMTDVDLVALYFGSAPTTFPGNFVHLATSAGHEAVSFFFVLSGFILTYVYAGTAESQGFAARKSDFWWARFARIAPTFYLGLLVSLPFLLYSVLVAHSVAPSRLMASLLLAPAFLQSWWPPVVYLWNFPSWSLSVEFLFYALFPLLASAAAFLPRRQFLLLALALVVATAYARAALFSHFHGAPNSLSDVAIYFPPLSVPQFILGIALARVFLYGPVLPSRAYKAILFLGLVATVAMFGWQSDLPPWLMWARTETGTVGIPFGAIIFGAAGAAGSFRLLASPAMVFLGDASYSMYILHIPVSLWWKWIATKALGLTVPPLLNFAVMVVLVIAIAALNQAYLEPPLRRWLLRRWPLRRGARSS
ncbi:MAG: acyltransferase [Enhydrobacter sp.]